MPATAVPAIVQLRYLSMLPTIQKYAFVRHRHLAPEERLEAAAEACAWGWQWCLRAFEKGTLAEVNPRMITLYAARLYRSGRLVGAGGFEPATATPRGQDHGCNPHSDKALGRMPVAGVSRDSGCPHSGARPHKRPGP